MGSGVKPWPGQAQKPADRLRYHFFFFVLISQRLGTVGDTVLSWPEQEGLLSSSREGLSRGCQSTHAAVNSWMHFVPPEGRQTQRGLTPCFRPLQLQADLFMPGGSSSQLHGAGGGTARALRPPRFGMGPLCRWRNRLLLLAFLPAYTTLA